MRTLLTMAAALAAVALTNIAALASDKPVLTVYTYEILYVRMGPGPGHRNRLRGTLQL